MLRRGPGREGIGAYTWGKRIVGASTSKAQTAGSLATERDDREAGAEGDRVMSTAEPKMNKRAYRQTALAMEMRFRRVIIPTPLSMKSKMLRMNGAVKTPTMVGLRMQLHA